MSCHRQFRFGILRARAAPAATSPRLQPSSLPPTSCTSPQKLSTTHASYFTYATLLRSHTTPQVLDHVEVVAVALGVLINLASIEQAVCRELTSPRPGRGGRGSGEGGVLPLLCAILNATAEGVAAAPPGGGGGEPVSPCAAAATPARDGRRSGGAATSPAPAPAASPSWSAGTPSEPASPPAAAAASPEDDARAGEAAIAEAYCAMLAGFLLRGDAGLQVRAAGLLSGGSLAPVVAAVRRCLSFYVTAGAITEGSRDKLAQLLAELEADDGGGGGGAVGAAGGGASDSSGDEGSDGK
jgi:hypothetical protein